MKNEIKTIQEELNKIFLRLPMSTVRQLFDKLRDCSIDELHKMEARGEKVGILKEAFKKNQVISSISREFDHKSTLEIFTDEDYSGKDVVIGRFVKAAEWKKALEDAIRDERSCVVQEYAEVKEEKFPVLNEDGTVTMERNYEIAGFASSESGLALMARCSTEPVVNISRRGGIIPVVLVE